MSDTDMASDRQDTDSRSSVVGKKERLTRSISGKPVALLQLWCLDPCSQAISTLKSSR